MKPLLANAPAAVVICLLAFLASSLHAMPADFVAGFGDRMNDGFKGNAFFEATGGNPDGNAHFFVEALGISMRTGELDGPSNANFLGDYSGFEEVTFGVDVQVDSITFRGAEVPRNLGVMLVDRDIQGGSGPSGLWFTFGTISSTLTRDWTHFEIIIDDPTQAELPPGWIGFGEQDPNSFEPLLPEGATFATVLAGVDELRVSTIEPGFAFGFTVFDVRVDNVSVSVVPEPTSFTLLASACGVTFFRLRRRESGSDVLA